jgi:hypothetical protein
VERECLGYKFWVLIPLKSILSFRLLIDL